MDKADDSPAPDTCRPPKESNILVQFFMDGGWVMFLFVFLMLLIALFYLFK